MDGKTTEAGDSIEVAGVRFTARKFAMPFPYPVELCESDSTRRIREDRSARLQAETDAVFAGYERD